MKKAQENNLFGDFGSARMYVLGAGVMQPSSNRSTAERDGYRDPKTWMLLKQLWGEYFSRSNALIVAVAVLADCATKATVC